MDTLPCGRVFLTQHYQCRHVVIPIRVDGMNGGSLSIIIASDDACNLVGIATSSRVSYLLNCLLLALFVRRSPIVTDVVSMSATILA